MITAADSLSTDSPDQLLIRAYLECGQTASGGRVCAHDVHIDTLTNWHRLLRRNSVISFLRRVVKHTVICKKISSKATNDWF